MGDGLLSCAHWYPGVHLEPSPRRCLSQAALWQQSVKVSSGGRDARASARITMGVTQEGGCIMVPDVEARPTPVVKASQS